MSHLQDHQITSWLPITALTLWKCLPYRQDVEMIPSGFAALSLTLCSPLLTYQCAFVSFTKCYEAKVLRNPTAPPASRFTRCCSRVAPAAAFATTNRANGTRVGYEQPRARSRTPRLLLCFCCEGDLRCHRPTCPSSFVARAVISRVSTWTQGLSTV